VQHAAASVETAAVCLQNFLYASSAELNAYRADLDAYRADLNAYDVEADA